MLWALSVVWWGLVGLVGKLLRISNEIWVWLNLFPLPRSSSSLSLVTGKLNSLVSTSWSCRTWLNHCLLPFHLTWTYIAMHVLLMLCRWASGSLIWALRLVLVLLEHQLLLFEYLNLVSILNGCGSFSVRWWIGDYLDLFRTSEIFFILSSLVFKVELLCLAKISFRCKWMVNHVHVWILTILLTTWALMMTIWVSTWSLHILSTLRILFAAVGAVSVSRLSVRISWGSRLTLSSLNSRLVDHSSACHFWLRGTCFVVRIWAWVAFMTWWMSSWLVVLSRLVTALIYCLLLVLGLSTLSIGSIWGLGRILLSQSFLLLPELFLLLSV